MNESVENLMGNDSPPVSSGAGGSSDEPAWASSGDPGVEVLHPNFDSRTIAVYLLPWTPFIFIFFLIAMLVGGFIGLYGLMGALGPLLFGLLGAALYTAGLVYAHWRQTAAVTVLVSPTGVECSDLLGTRVRMRWRDVTAIGRVQQFMVHRAPRSLAWAASSARGRTALGGPLYPTSDGLIGWGEQVLPTKGANSGRLRSVLASQPRDPQTGRTQVAVAFNAAGRPGQDNRLLAYAWHYRPDLFTPPPATG